MLKLNKPLDYCLITQPFGVNWAAQNIYAQLGLKGHNGLDFRAKNGTAVYAVFDGYVSYLLDDVVAGKGIYILKDDSKYEACYFHLKKFLVNKGQKVKAGDKIGESDSTGTWCFGAHLHFGLRPIPYVANDGFNGWVDPYPFFPENFDKLPVDLRYNKPKDWLAEWKIRFKNSWIHRQLISYGRKPLSLSSQEVNALVYGHWDWHYVMDSSMWPIWSQLTKEDWKKGIEPPIQLSI